MTQRTNAWKIGLFVIGGVVTALAALFWVGKGRLEREVAPIVTYFEETVQGLEIGSPVKVRGVTIGKVARITIAPDRRLVEVQLDMFLDVLRRLGLAEEGDLRAYGPGEVVGPEDVRTQLASVGITGTKYVLLDFFDQELYPQQEIGFPIPLPWISSTPSTLKTLEEGVNSIIESMPRMLVSIESLAERVEGLVDELELGALVTRIEAFLDDFSAELHSMDLAQLGQDADGLLKDLAETSAALRRLVEGLESPEGPLGTAASSVDGAAGSLEQATASISAAAARAEDLLEGIEVEPTLVSLRETLAAVRELARMLERDPGALLRGRPNVTGAPPR